jgi:hypothetical protein
MSQLQRAVTVKLTSPAVFNSFAITVVDLGQDAEKNWRDAPDPASAQEQVFVSVLGKSEWTSGTLLLGFWIRSWGCSVRSDQPPCSSQLSPRALRARRLECAAGVSGDDYEHGLPAKGFRPDDRLALPAL